MRLNEALGRWRPGAGVIRLALICGLMGAIAGGFLYWVKVWNWADSPSWPHAHYSELSKLRGVVPETDEDGNPVLIAVRPKGDSRPYSEFREAVDLNASELSPADWAKSKPADPKQTSPRVLVTADNRDGNWWGNPEFIRLRTHPPQTTVYYAILERGSDSIPDGGYLRYFVLPTVPVFGFLLSFAAVLSLAWVWDGFKPAPAAPAKP